MKTVDELEKKRELLIRARSGLVGRPFFMYRKKLQKKVKEIDRQLDPIDMEICNYYKSLTKQLEKEYREADDACDDAWVAVHYCGGEYSEVAYNEAASARCAAFKRWKAALKKEEES